MRASSGAIMTGVGTVLADDPSLTVRDAGFRISGQQPLRVVVDSRLRMSPASRMLSLDGDTLVFCIDDSNKRALDRAGAAVIKVSPSDNRTSLIEVLQELAAMEINDVLVEAGSSLVGNLISDELVDEFVIYQAPHLMGSRTRRMVESPNWLTLADRRALEIMDLRKFGDDLRIIARPAN